jgi:NADPH:quinone reductase-like Zn-dependent oxidoreductase
MVPSTLTSAPPRSGPRLRRAAARCAALAVSFGCLAAPALPAGAPGRSAVSAAASRTAPAPAMPQSRALVNRRVVLEKTAAGYRWKLTNGPLPRMRDHQVLIHVRAVSLNRDDVEILTSDPGHDLSGRQVSTDAAGDVVAVGQRVTQVRPGMRVTNTFFRRFLDGAPSAEKVADIYGFTIDGVLADYISIDDTAVVPIPPGLSYEEAATLPTAGLTAWKATIGQRVIRPGSIVLVQGTGGVSTFALQFAAAAGARVIQTSSSDEKLKRSESIAPHESINYRAVPDWSARVLALTHGHGADLVVDIGGKSTIAQSVRSLAYGGTLALVGVVTGYDGTIPEGSLMMRAARAQGIFVGSRADYLRMDAFITAHHLHPVIEQVVPFERFQEALRDLGSDRFVGKIVLRM